MTHALRLLGFSLLIGLLLMLVKFAAWWWTQSNAILSDAMESIVNVVAGGIALLALYLARRPRDQSHPYGHGKLEFISAGFEGALILFAGLGIAGKAIYNLIEPQQLSQIDLGLVLTAITGSANFALGWMLKRKGKRESSLLLEANGAHLMTDAWSSAGLLLGLTLVWWSGFVWLDNLIALIFSGLILYTGFRLVRSSLAGILDETDLETIERIVEVLEKERTPAWIDLHNMRVIKYGRDYHVDCHMTMPWYFSNRETHREIDEVQRNVHDQAVGNVEFFIHVDPCTSRSCPLCTISDCEVRERPFQKKLNWTAELAMQIERHEID